MTPGTMLSNIDFATGRARTKLCRARRVPQWSRYSEKILTLYVKGCPLFRVVLPPLLPLAVKLAPQFNCAWTNANRSFAVNI